MPLRRLLTSGGGGSGGSSGGGGSYMFPLNGILSCKWDNVNGKPDILEIDGEDSTKVNLKATDFHIQMNFANGLDDDSRPQGLIKSLTADQVLTFGASYASKTLQILAKLDNEESDPSIVFYDITSVTGWDYYTDDFVPVMSSASQNGFVISGSSDAWEAFDGTTTGARLGSGGTRGLVVEMPYEVSLYRLYSAHSSSVYLKKIEGFSIALNDYVEIWSGSIKGVNSSTFRDTGILNSENALSLYKKFRFSYYAGGTTFVNVYEVKVNIRPMLKYSKSENKCYVNNGSGFVQGLYVPLGCVVTNASGEVTTLSTYFNTYEFLPVGMLSQ